MGISRTEKMIIKKTRPSLLGPEFDIEDSTAGSVSGGEV